jgi:hypothetical protein
MCKNLRVMTCESFDVYRKINRILNEITRIYFESLDLYNKSGVLGNRWTVLCMLIDLSYNNFQVSELFNEVLDLFKIYTPCVATPKACYIQSNIDDSKVLVSNINLMSSRANRMFKV